jgi:hypothetical protein
LPSTIKFAGKSEIYSEGAINIIKLLALKTSSWETESSGIFSNIQEENGLSPLPPATVG